MAAFQKFKIKFDPARPGYRIYGQNLLGMQDEPAEIGSPVRQVRHPGATCRPSRRQPDANAEQMREFNERQRHSTTSENAARIVEFIDSLGETDTAKRLSMPTLVLHCIGDARVPFEEGRRLASVIEGSRFRA